MMPHNNAQWADTRGRLVSVKSRTESSRSIDFATMSKLHFSVSYLG